MINFSSYSMLRGLSVLTLMSIFQEIQAGRDTFVKSDWIFYIVSSGVCSVIAAYGIGANDVANAFATSVGSKALTIKQAVILASIFEFCRGCTYGKQCI